MTRSAAFSRPVDRANRPVAPVVLDWIYPPVMILALALMEFLFGRTPGKAIMGLRVRGAGGGRIALHAALARNIVIYGAVAIVAALPVLAALMGVTLSFGTYAVAVVVFGLLAWAPVLMLAAAKPQAPYDRWFGAEVVAA